MLYPHGTLVLVVARLVRLLRARTATCNNVGVPVDLMGILTSGTVVESGVTPNRISTLQQRLTLLARLR